VLPYRPRGALTRWFERLGNRSLGAVLFSHHGFSRGALKTKRLDHRHALYQPAIDAMKLDPSAPPTLWARRSLFVFRSQSVLVTEVFSPALRAVPTRP
jgi:chorismate--pyruvate lyase